MDILKKSPISPFQKHKRHLFVMICAVLLIAVIVAMINMDFKTPRVDKEKIRIGTVKSGTFEVIVSANGKLISEEIEWIASQVDGNVAKIHARPGDFVKKDQIIVTLANPIINNIAAEAAIELNGAKAVLDAKKVDIETDILDQEAHYSHAEIAYQGAKIQLEAETRLNKLDNPPISAIVYEKTKLEMTKHKTILAIEIKKLERMRKNAKAQLVAEESKVKQLEQKLALALDQLNSLDVKSTLEGVVQTLPLEIGQSVRVGSEITRVATPQKLYAELKVAARQASDVVVGQRVVVDTQKGIIDGTVIRIDPNVIAGNVTVDVALSGELPSTARPDLNVDGKIFVSEIRNAIYVDKLAQAKENFIVTLYKLDKEERYAKKITVELGKISSSFMQISKGLSVGDKIVISDDNAWKSDELKLN